MLWFVCFHDLIRFQVNTLFNIGEPGIGPGAENSLYKEKYNCLSGVQAQGFRVSLLSSHLFLQF